MGQSGQSAQAPTLDVNQSTALTRRQLDMQRRNLGPFAQAYGSAFRDQNTRNSLYGLMMLTNPGEAMGRALEQETRPLLSQAQKDLTALEKAKAVTNRRTGETTYKVGKDVLSAADFDARRSGLQSSIEGYTSDLNRARTFDPVGELKTTFADQYAMRDRLLGDMGRTIDSTAEYGRFQDALGRGISAQEVGQRQAALAQAQAAGMGQVADVRAREVGSGALGDTLMNRAMDMARSEGRLSAEANRDAVQAARAGMASRGMATGNAGLAAELLNRDRFSRQRMFQDLGFAQGIQGQDLERQLANAGNVLRADMGNQQTQFGREQILSGNQQQANLSNMQAANNMAQFNTELGSNIDRFNAGQRDSTNRYNIGLLGQSAALSDAERTRQLMTQQDMYNFSMSTDPRMMLAGIGSPYANMAAPAGSALTSLIGMAQPQFSGGQFSQPGAGSMMAGGLGGAMSGAAMGSALGPWGAVAGGALGLGAGLLQQQ